MEHTQRFVARNPVVTTASSVGLVSRAMSAPPVFVYDPLRGMVGW